jgi:GTP-binding protein EngB required for normal cell division
MSATKEYIFVHDYTLTCKSAGSDLFIVCGDGGVGKSSFIKSITGEEVYIGSTLQSGKVAISFELRVSLELTVNRY